MGVKPVFNSLFKLFGKNAVEPEIDNHVDGVGNKTVPDSSSLSPEEKEAVCDMALKINSKIDADNRKRIIDYWDFWESNVFEMKNTNSNLLGSFSYDNFFVDLSFRNFMRDESFVKPTLGIFDVDGTLFKKGNLTYNSHSNRIGLMDVGVKQGIFNSPDELFYGYMGMSDFSAEGDRIINIDGMYDVSKLLKMDLHLSRGFAEIYNLHKDGGGDAFFEAKLYFLKEMCAHPEKTCISQTYFHDLMLLRHFYDTVALITLSDNDIAKVIFEISDLVMPDFNCGQVISMGSTLSVGARKIDITDDNSLKKHVNLAFGPKKVNLLNNYFRKSGVSEEMRTISSISDILSSDPLAFSLEDMVNIENVCGLDHPLAVVAYDKIPGQFNLSLTSDNIEDFSGLNELSPKGNIGRIICNFVENNQNGDWSDVIKKYADENGIDFNKIKKATDVVTLELFEQSIKTILFDYGFSGIKYICSELDEIRPLIEEYGVGRGDDSDDILENIRDRFESLRDTLIKDYHGDVKSSGSSDDNATLFLNLLNLEIADMGNNAYGVERLGSRIKTSGLFNMDKQTIENIEKSLSGQGEDYVKSMREFLGFSYFSESQVTSVSDILRGIYLKNNHDCFGEVVGMFLDPEKSYVFLARTYGDSPETLSVLDRVTKKNEIFLRCMN
ncbi:MAG: hypothetical protein GQ477_03250 [Nanohaloarchaea archaeon]|nr:hypothetical protein [Candidatus Nanohaloarchaea archaeon]